VVLLHRQQPAHHHHRSSNSSSSSSDVPFTSMLCWIRDRAVNGRTLVWMTHAALLAVGGAAVQVWMHVHRTAMAIIGVYDAVRGS
jgi:hypothetical protein